MYPLAQRCSLYSWPCPDPLKLDSKLDRCVMCGMCSPHCPTYALSLDENESPRGRIALISAYLKGELALDERLMGHLDHCLACRACEHYCPSAVAFGRIMDETRVLLESRRHRPWHTRLLRNWALETIANKQRLRRVFRLLSRYQRWGIQSVLRGSGLLHLLGLAGVEKQLPVIPEMRPWHDYYPPRTSARGNVALFTGCLNEPLGQAGLDSAIRVLNVLGYGVYVPAAQGCCGALHRHNGDPGQAAQLARQNLAAFAKLEVEAILHTATGCTAALAEYADLPGLSEEMRGQAQRFAAKVSDINQFLCDAAWPDEVRCEPLPQRVAVHTPCSQVHVLRQGDTPLRLLQRIPKLDLVELIDNERCCGGAGSYLLTQPAWSERLRQPKIAHLEELGAHTLVTSNIGCALHLQAGLRARGMDIEVCHPVELLARQLGATS